jgi:hypothetical protein
VAAASSSLASSFFLLQLLMYSTPAFRTTDPPRPAKRAPVPDTSSRDGRKKHQRYVAFVTDWKGKSITSSKCKVSLVFGVNRMVRTGSLQTGESRSREREGG